MGIKFSNNASAALAASISSTSTSITVTTGQGALFPALASGDYFYAALVDSSNNIEFVKVTARSGDTMTAVRGQEGTTARAYLAADKFVLRLTAGSLNAVVTDLQSQLTSTVSALGTMSSQNANAVAVTGGNMSGVALGTGMTAPTQSVGTADTTIATTAFVDRLRSLQVNTTTTTLAIGDRGNLVKITLDMTVPANVFSGGDVVTLYNDNTISRAVLQGSGMTLRFAGTTSTGNRALAAKGLASVVFLSATEAVISGGGVS